MPSSTRVNFSPAVGFRAVLERAAGGPLPDWPEFAARVELREVERGGTVFAQDQVHPSVYVVTHGLIKLAYLDEHGDEWIKSFIAEGQFFGSIAALAPAGRTTFMSVALERSRLECVTFGEIERLAARHLAWSRAVGAILMTYAARKEQRERELLTLTPEQRYFEFCRHSARLLDRIPQKALARHLGVTPVGLNRIVARVKMGSDPIS